MAPLAVDKSTWYVNEEENLAVSFESTEKKISGTYVLCDHALETPQAFTASRSKKKLKFSFTGNPSLSIKGSFVYGKDHFMLKDKKNNQVVFSAQSLKNYGPLPLRYQSPVFNKVQIRERNYGVAPGFYASKPVDDAGASEYAGIVLDVAKTVTINMFKEDVPLNMDIYTPIGDTAHNRPLLLLIHGGAFVAGDKKDMFPAALANYYASHGFVVASINYRMGYVFLPGMYSNLERCMYRGVQDVRAALRYLSEHKNEFGIDPQMVFVGGNSAGGFLSLFAAYMKDDEAWTSAEGSYLKFQSDLGSLDGAANNSGARYSIRGIINMWGAVNDLSIIDQDEKIPALLIHGTSDRIVPCGFDYPFRNLDPQLTSFFVQKVYGSDFIRMRMESLNIPVNFLRIDNADHEPQCNGDNTFSAQYPIIRDSILSFMNRQLFCRDFAIKGPQMVAASDAPSVYTVKNISLTPVRWSCTGGFIAKETPTAVRVVWIAGSEKKVLTATGVGKQGQIQSISWTVEE